MTTIKYVSVLSALLFLAVAGFLALGGYQSLLPDYSNNRSDGPSSNKLSPEVSPVTAQEKSRVSAMDSSDGTKLLTMETLGQEYSFFASNKDGTERKLIYSVIAQKSDSYSIPFNTWSPNNLYFYILKTYPQGTEYFVFQASGEPFPGNIPFVNMNSLVSEKLTDRSLLNIPGWGPNLLIINTKDSQGAESTSYWVNVVTHEFIPLATHYH